MKTLTVDDYQRVRLPKEFARPRSKLAYEENGNTITLTILKAEAEETFPRGSLVKYLTPDKGREELALLKGCVQGPE